MWLRAQHAAGVVVRGTKLQKAAQKFACLHEEHDFKAFEGWLFQFQLHHGLSNKRTHGEALDANEESVEFCTKFTKLIQKEGLILSQIYNTDETDLFYRSTPTNTLVAK